GARVSSYVVRTAVGDLDTPSYSMYCAGTTSTVITRRAMLLKLSDLSSETLQEQLVRQVRALILRGELAGGDELPSIRGLARDHQVSVITVQRAYEALERHGLIQ